MIAVPSNLLASSHFGKVLINSCTCLWWCTTRSLTNRPKLTLFSKSSDCSLCDDAKEALADYKHLFDLEEIDISKPENRRWYKLYRYDIPVIHLNGQFLMKHRVDLTALKKAIAGLDGKTDSAAS